MTEHPILFSAPMIRAILDGRKTVTRRIVNLDVGGCIKRAGKRLPPADPNAALGCPHGQAGDALWVRETWAHVPTRGAANHVQWRGTLYTPRNCIYRADDPKLPVLRWGKEGFEPFKWAPLIHMPRWASRITLRITNVRVERVRDITEDDAAAEGCSTIVESDGSVTCGRRKSEFRQLWDGLNARRGFGWDTNPWVWRIEFERVEPKP